MGPTQCLLRHLGFVALILLVHVNLRAEAQAQLPGVSRDFCPPPARFAPGGGGLMCVCPDGTPYNLGASCGRQPPPPDEVGDRCSNGGTCPLGSMCSWMPGRCVPDGKVDCGSYFCEPGSRCGADQRYRACLASDEIDCGSYKCQAGNKCASGGCIAQDATDCGNGISCGGGLKCSRNRKMCLQQNAVDCDSFSCQAGMKCASGDRCITKDAVDCGKGRSCPSGTRCVGAQAECLTPQQIVDRAAAEKRRKEEEVAAKKRAEEERKAAELRRIEEQREALRRKEQERLAAIAKKKQEEQQKAAEQKKQQEDARLAAAKAKSPPSPASTTSSPPPVQAVSAPGSTQDVSKNGDVQMLLSNPTIATSGDYGRAINGSIVDLRTGAVVAKGGVTSNPGPSPPQAPTPAAPVTPAQPASPGTVTSAPPASPPKYTFAQTPYGTVEILKDGNRIGTGTPEYAAQFGYKPSSAATSQVNATVGPSVGPAVPSASPAQPSIPQQSSSIAAPSQTVTNSDVRRLLTDPAIALSGNYGRTVNGSIVDFRTGTVVATGGVTTVSAAPASAASGALRAPPAVVAMTSSANATNPSAKSTSISTPLSNASTAITPAAPSLTYFYAQPSAAISTPQAIVTQPQQAPGLWKSLETVAKANQRALESGPGQIVTDTLAAAGAPFAEKFDPRLLYIGRMKEIAEAVDHIRRKEWMEAAEQGANFVTVEAAGALGAASALAKGKNPVLGASYGRGAAQGAITTWKVYGAPVIGEWLIQQFPQAFVPHSTTP